MDETTVFCGNCGRGLDFRSDIPAKEREPCPVCGSTVREFRDSGTVTVRVVVASASDVASTPGVRVEGVPADQTPEAERVRGQYRATLDWLNLEGDLWMLHVLNERGEVVEGGIGDDPTDALLEVYERLVPPT
jgi:hypothetical protein